ncbi:amino acid permease [Oesophagostomum dentatum]|uniref:Amino acid permease n=1 Tax=Oesophagostomum dentatum TaxID=61180 RepID=A0A0B1T345_OESDE|nr:amino acid permease [Oesophagostomum dentatum]
MKTLISRAYTLFFCFYIKYSVSIYYIFRRRFSTVTQLNPETLETVEKKSELLFSLFSWDASSKPGAQLESIGEEPPEEYKGARKFTATFGHLALYKGPEDDAQQASFISGYTTPGPKERESSSQKKANLGVLLGVYLPTIQHILGVTMFIRLFWVVGMAGLWWTLVLLGICCSCTLLTSISLSAVATNGVVESGGAYFIISRNLGAEFGSAVGILFYLANTVAASMYIVGGVEVLLMYIVPDMAIGGREALHDTDPLGPLYNNYRIYGTVFLLLQVLIVAMGVKFVQLLAPVSLLCVILAILACFAGGVEKAITHSGQMVCSLDDRLIQSVVLYKNHNSSHTNITNPTICDVCDKSPGLTHLFCDSGEFCSEYTKVKIACTQGFPGLNMATLKDNLDPAYMQRDEVLPGMRGKPDAEVVQDVTSTFFLLLAIYFPAVTGIMTGTNMSGDLRDPQRSIPSGTIAATVTTSIIYYALAVVFAASVDRAVLRDKFGRSIDNNMVVSTLAWPSPWVVTVGSFLSTFGAALQCLCSAPRLLQSIAKDDVIPILAPFAKVTSSNEPLLGLLLTTFIAELAILLGAVDKIAEVLDFFFLMCYAFVNLIAFLHSVLRAPNWRPRFKYFHWFLSLIGAFLCFFIMFASDWRLALIACGMTFAIYKYVEWKGFGRSIDNNMVVSTLAWPSPWVVTVGSFLSTFGAALQCLCSAPRLLQSIAKDDVIPILAPFAKVTSSNEPLLGLLLTTFIAELAILLGAVDKIAEVLDFFFLMCYAFVNLIAFLHSVLRAPNWRPRFKYFHWFLSLIGAFLCFFIMFASDWRLALIACGMTFAIYKYVEWKGAKKEWGDGMRGLALTTAQYSLLKVEDKDPHPKNWRPQLLICLSTTWSKEMLDLRAMSMLNLGAQLKAGQGLTIACAFLKGSVDNAKDKQHAQDVKDRLTKDMQKIRLRGFSKTIFYSRDQMNGCVSALYQSIGIGGLRPNTVLLSWPKAEYAEEVELFIEKLLYGIINENCVLVAKGITDFPDSNDRLIGYIDIWWIVLDGGILMLIAYLLKQHKVWRGCTLRIFAIGDNDSTKNEEIRKGLQKYIYMLRIDAELFMVNLLDLEVSEEVVEKTAELEKKQQTIKDEIKRSRSRESGFTNDAYNNDDTISSRKLRLSKLLP